MPDQISASELWAKTVDVVKNRVNSRSLWETLEQTAGIIIENGTFIIGLNSRVFNLAGHLNVSDHKNAIEQAASQIAGVPINVRVIEGDTLADWIATKQRDERIAVMREATYKKKDREREASQSWDAVYDLIARSYSSLPLRQLPQVKARFLADMLYVLSDAVDQLMPENPDESTERLLSRVIERVAISAEVPAAVVALELDRLRAWQKQNPD